MREQSRPIRLLTTHRLTVLGIGFVFILCVRGNVQAQEQKSRSKPYQVVMFTGSDEDVDFWNLFERFMKSAAEDLEMEIDFRYMANNRQRMWEELRKLCAGSKKPDAVVIQAFKESGARALEITEGHEVPTFLVNSGLTEEQRERFGEPREKLKSWVGEMVPNDRDAGYKVAIELIDEAKRKGRVDADGKVHVLGINGVVSDFASVERKAGLDDAINSRDDAVLDQLISADWKKDAARKRFPFLHRRHPSASVVWSASDDMAAGVIAALDDLSLTPGADIIVGGVDALPSAMPMIELGTLHASIGGHFMEGGWVAVMLYDYFHGIDFEQIPNSTMTLVTQANLADYQSATEQQTWERFDFRSLTKTHNPEQAGYDFRTEDLTSVELREGEGSSIDGLIDPQASDGS